MARVECTVEEVDVTNDSGREIPGICVACGRCDHKVEVFGRSESSEKRGLVMLREQCPEEEQNFYVLG